MFLTFKKLKAQRNAPVKCLADLKKFHNATDGKVLQILMIGVWLPKKLNIDAFQNELTRLMGHYFVISDLAIIEMKSKQLSITKFQQFLQELQGDMNNLLLIMYISDKLEPQIKITEKPKVIEKSEITENNSKISKAPKNSNKTEKSEKSEKFIRVSNKYLNKLIRDRLTLLLHVVKCDKAQIKTCTNTFCNTFKVILKHMKTCQTGDSCEFPFCTSSSKILNHWTYCESTSCSICLPEIQVEVQSGESSDQQEKVEATQVIKSIILKQSSPPFFL